MKLSFSSNGLVRYSVFEAINKIADAGYTGIELLADVPHLFIPKVDNDTLFKLKKVLRNRSLEVANLNVNTVNGYYGRKFWEPLFEPSLANPDPDARKWRLDYTLKAIEIAAAIKSPTISITSGRPVPGCEPDRGLELLATSLKTVLAFATERNILVAIEYEPGLLIENCKELKSFLDYMASPFLGANLDLGHCRVAGEDLSITINSLGEKIFHIHLEDIKDRKHYHLIPGLGNIDFKKIFIALENISYDGFVTVELYTYPHKPEIAAEQALGYLRRFQAWE